MNHRSSGLLISDASEGLLLAKLAEGRRPRAITSYRHDLHVWLDHTGDKDVDHVTAQGVQTFLLYLRIDYQPRRLSGDGWPARAQNTIQSGRERRSVRQTEWTWPSVWSGRGSGGCGLPGRLRVRATGGRRYFGEAWLGDSYNWMDNRDSLG
jgi:hypothetical protein